jgi:hypothetical protein
MHVFKKYKIMIPWTYNNSRFKFCCLENALIVHKLTLIVPIRSTELELIRQRCHVVPWRQIRPVDWLITCRNRECAILFHDWNEYIDSDTPETSIYSFICMNNKCAINTQDSSEGSILIFAGSGGLSFILSTSITKKRKTRLIRICFKSKSLILR